MNQDWEKGLSDTFVAQFYKTICLLCEREQLQYRNICKIFVEFLPFSIQL